MDTSLKTMILKELLSFTKRERAGIAVLLALILAGSVWPVFFTEPPAVGNSREDLQSALTRLQKAPKRSGRETAIARNHSRIVPDGHRDEKKPLFPFDPNHLSPKQWEQLGVKARTAMTIRHYLDKGGKFRRPGDLAEIYGLSPAAFQRLRPYIRINPKDTAAYAVSRKRYFWGHYDSSRYAKRRYYATHPVEINSADTGAWIALPGIGSRLAARIIHFRDKLGGFYAIDQVGETYGLPDSVFEKIKSRLRCKPVMRTIDINRADVSQLQAHPYISWNLANAIVQYRTQHGPYKALTGLMKIAIMTRDLYRRINPYLSL